MYLPGSGGLGLDCNDNGEEFKCEKKWDQGRLQEGRKRLWHHCYSSSLSFCLSITNPSVPVSPTGCYIFHKKITPSVSPDSYPNLSPSLYFSVCAFLFVLLLSVIETKLNLGSVFSFFQCPDQALARLPKFNLTMTQPNFTHGLNKIDKPVTRYLSVSPTVCLLSLLLSVVSFPQQTVVKCSPVANITTPQPGSLILISSSLSLSYTQTYIHICTFFAPHTPRAPFALWGL